MKKMPSCLCAFLFLLLILGFPLAGLLFGREALSGGATEENRELLSFPAVEDLETLEAFPAAFQDWFTDHLFFKEKLAACKAMLEKGIFGELDSSLVVAGTETPWLFNRSGDGMPMETYKRTNLFTEEELLAIGDNLEMLRLDLSDAGIAFVLMISPDKEQIYGEDYMPSWVKREENEGRTRQFLAYMEAHYPEIRLVYPAEKLKAAKASGLLYYESDTHWNRAGAEIGCRELLRELVDCLGLPDPEVPAFHFQADGKKRGDLQKLVQLGASYDSTELSTVEEGRAEVLRTVQDGNAEIIWEKSENREAYALPARIYLSGDSFRWNLTRFLQDSVREAVISSRFYLDLDDLAAEEPDVFVYSIAERYLQELDMLPGYNTMALTR